MVLLDHSSTTESIFWRWLSGWFHWALIWIRMSPLKPSYERLSLWGARNYWERLESLRGGALCSSTLLTVCHELIIHLHGLFLHDPLLSTGLNSWSTLCLYTQVSQTRHAPLYDSHLRCLLQQWKADSHTYLVWQWRLQVPALLAFRTCVFQTFFHSVIWHHHCPSRMKKKIGFHDTNCGVFNRKTVFQGQ